MGYFRPKKFRQKPGSPNYIRSMSHFGPNRRPPSCRVMFVTMRWFWRPGVIFCWRKVVGKLLENFLRFPLVKKYWISVESKNGVYIIIFNGLGRSAQYYFNPFFACPISISYQCGLFFALKNQNCGRIRNWTRNLFFFIFTVFFHILYI